MKSLKTWSPGWAPGMLGLWLSLGCGAEQVPTPEPRGRVMQQVSSCAGPSGALCGFVTPAEAGTAGSGNSPAPHVVVRPTSPSRAELIVYLPGTGSQPADILSTAYADRDHTLYASAVSKGYRMIGLSYQNQPSVRSLCSDSDACFLATRRTLISGSVQPGSAVTSMDKADAILPRLKALLLYLRDTVDPAGNWGSYFTQPACTTDCVLDPAKIIVSGQSQGGGHAGVIGRDYAVRRVVTLASPCDAMGTNGAWASWTLPPLATAPGADRYRGLIARGQAGTQENRDACEEAAIAHWAPERMNAQWKLVISSTGLCVTDPHECVGRDAQLYAEWLELWP
ncbi:MAG TPA: hypothetical protein VFZ09_47885 [Archangium sp.]|uniref:BPSS1187 family protein n=1 Tax=Archangium sp. TaxID=1872627 RepID=UPI002E35275E|nr:hypothetical protein [Archangium sp.]HEX5753997.1 hypothetical protein [Archangium sp.]